MLSRPNLQMLSTVKLLSVHTLLLNIIIKIITSHETYFKTDIFTQIRCSLEYVVFRKNLLIYFLIKIYLNFFSISLIDFENK